jgi:ATP-dependent phosphoenolpyruvate carboxykinase
VCLRKSSCRRGAWAEASVYDAIAQKLAGLFRENFKTCEAGVSAEIKAAGPA